MIQTVTSVQLPVDETLSIKRNRLLPEGVREGDAQSTGIPRISIVTGIHGDELEGQYVCYELQRRIKENQKCLTGIVDIYPAMNPLGIDSITRGIPDFDLDLNRLFPGSGDGDMTDVLAAGIIEAVEGSDLVFDIHASNIYLTEIPQIRINEKTRDALVPIAMHCNVDFLWVHSASTVLESTFAFALNSRGTKTLVVEMGVGMRITKSIGNQLVDGIFCAMKEEGAWSGDVITPKTPILSEDPNEVVFLNASTGGIFIRDKKAGDPVRKGDVVGRLVDPISGTLLENVTSPVDGLLFTIREYPVVSQGSLMGRILKRGGEKK